MRVRFWGVRGSLPVPGPATERYGGNTSCVEVVTRAGTRIIVDAGTGIRLLGKEMMVEGGQTIGAGGAFAAGNGAAHILISHTHWDHIQGLPFFSPLYRKGNRLTVYGRQHDDVPMRAVLPAQSGSPYFPVLSSGERATVTFRDLPDDARFEIEDAKVNSTRLNHPYVATAYGIVADGAKVVYVSDTAPFTDILFDRDFVPGPPPAGSVLPETSRALLVAMRSNVIRLCEGADLVIYDTMFTPEDYRAFPHYGHSRPHDALEIARSAGAKTLALYHHAPERADHEVDRMLVETRAEVAQSGGGIDVIAAFEGLDLMLGKT